MFLESYRTYINTLCWLALGVFVFFVSVLIFGEDLFLNEDDLGPTTTMTLFALSFVGWVFLSVVISILSIYQEIWIQVKRTDTNTSNIFRLLKKPAPFLLLLAIASLTIIIVV